jgi:hypothetical protein
MDASGMGILLNLKKWKVHNVVGFQIQIKTFGLPRFEGTRKEIRRNNVSWPRWAGIALQYGSAN